MGAGSHGGFGNTAGSANASKGKTFMRVQYEGTVTVNGVTRDVSRRVYQRNDIDLKYRDPETGKTNLQLMQAGKAPIGNDGNPVQLHHVLQKESGPMAEVREVTHSEYHRTLHGLVESGNSFDYYSPIGPSFQFLTSVFPTSGGHRSDVAATSFPHTPH